MSRSPSTPSVRPSACRPSGRARATDDGDALVVLETRDRAERRIIGFDDDLADTALPARTGRRVEEAETVTR